MIKNVNEEGKKVNSTMLTTIDENRVLSHPPPRLPLKKEEKHPKGPCCCWSPFLFTIILLGFMTPPVLWCYVFAFSQWIYPLRDLTGVLLGFLGMLVLFAIEFGFLWWFLWRQSKKDTKKWKITITSYPPLPSVDSGLPPPHSAGPEITLSLSSRGPPPLPPRSPPPLPPRENEPTQNLPMRTPVIVTENQKMIEEV